MSAAMIPLLLAAAAVPAFDVESLARLRDRSTVAEAHLGEGNAGSSRAWTVARCSPEAVWKVITDHSRFAEFMPHLKSVEVSRRTESGERALQTVDAVFSTARYALDYSWDAGTLRVDYRLAQDVPHDVAAIEGHWQLWAFEGGTLIEYVSEVDIGRSVPGFVRRYLAESGARNAVEAVRDRAESRR
jgi:hypothetical protein